MPEEGVYESVLRSLRDDMHDVEDTLSSLLHVPDEEWNSELDELDRALIAAIKAREAIETALRMYQEAVK